VYEIDSFVKFQFRFIGIQIFITNEAQIVITLSQTKWIQTYTWSLEMNFLTLGHFLFFSVLCQLKIVKPIRQPGEKQTSFKNNYASAGCMDVKNKKFK
jgi:hypothetical protein